MFNFLESLGGSKVYGYFMSFNLKMNIIFCVQIYDTHLIFVNVVLFISLFLKTRGFLVTK